MQVVRTPVQFADRLLADRALLIRTIVADNYRAVLAHFAAIDTGARFWLEPSPDALIDMLVMMDREPGDRPLVNQCINVSWLGANASGTLHESVEVIREKARLAGADGVNASGLAALVDIARQDNGTAEAADTTVHAINADAAARTIMAEKQAAVQRFGKWAVIGTVALLVIAAYLYFKRKHP